MNRRSLLKSIAGLPLMPFAPRPDSPRFTGAPVEPMPKRPFTVTYVPNARTITIGHWDNPGNWEGGNLPADGECVDFDTT